MHTLNSRDEVRTTADRASSEPPQPLMARELRRARRQSQAAGRRGRGGRGRGRSPRRRGLRAAGTHGGRGGVRQRQPAGGVALDVDDPRRRRPARSPSTWSPSGRAGSPRQRPGCSSRAGCRRTPPPWSPTGERLRSGFDSWPACCCPTPRGRSPSPGAPAGAGTTSAPGWRCSSPGRRWSPSAPRSATSSAGSPRPPWCPRSCSAAPWSPSCDSVRCWRPRPWPACPPSLTVMASAGVALVCAAVVGIVAGLVADRARVRDRAEAVAS